MSRSLWAVALALAALICLAALSLGADPTATPSASATEVLTGGDLRSEGEGPGLVGNPLLILLAVVGLGLATAVMTVLLARLIQRD